MDRLLYNHFKYYKAFINNIIVYFDTAEQHFVNFKTVFRLFFNKNIAIFLTKLFFKYLFVKLLSFRINTLNLLITINRFAAFRNLTFLR